MGMSLTNNEFSRMVDGERYFGEKDFDLSQGKEAKELAKSLREKGVRAIARKIPEIPGEMFGRESFYLLFICKADMHKYYNMDAS